MRIGTFNVQFIPSTFNDMPSGDDVFRAEQIAERILDSSYDFIVLNEVFDEDSRRASPVHSTNPREILRAVASAPAGARSGLDLDGGAHRGG